jgi:hypothetical protein
VSESWPEWLIVQALIRTGIPCEKLFEAILTGEGKVVRAAEAANVNKPVGVLGNEVMSPRLFLAKIAVAAKKLGEIALQLVCSIKVLPVFSRKFHPRLLSMKTRGEPQG